MPWPWLVALGAMTLLAILFLFYRLATAGLRLEQKQKLFLLQREHLEADFLRAATASGKPRGLHWKNLDWDSDVVFARDCKTGQLTALVGVTIQFEAVEGSDMEGLPAVGNLRNASGVFFYDRGRWRTIGKTVFNLNPAEALAHYKGQYERIEASRV